MKQLYRKLLIGLLMLLPLFVLSGCSLKPWVKPYERTNLADPIMRFGHAPVAERYMHHVYQAREGAKGAEGGSGGG